MNVYEIVDAGLEASRSVIWILFWNITFIGKDWILLRTAEMINSWNSLPVLM